MASALARDRILRYVHAGLGARGAMGRAARRRSGQFTCKAYGERLVAAVREAAAA